jgi:hypothetical protein
MYETLLVALYCITVLDVVLPPVRLWNVGSNVVLDRCNTIPLTGVWSTKLIRSP